MSLVAGSRALAIVPLVILEASRLGMRSVLNVSLVIFKALRSGIREVSNMPDPILVVGNKGMSAKAQVSAVLTLNLGIVGKSVVCHSPVDEILLFGNSGISLDARLRFDDAMVPVNLLVGMSGIRSTCNCSLTILSALKFGMNDVGNDVPLVI